MASKCMKMRLQTVIGRCYLVHSSEDRIDGAYIRSDGRTKGNDAERVHSKDQHQNK
jgi:hypothetical protein